MDTKDYLLILLPLFTAVITAAVTHFFTSRRDVQQKVRQEKIQRYENLIQAVTDGFLKNSNTKNQQENAKQEFYSHSYIVWLYGSDAVIEAMNAFVIAFNKGDKSDEALYSKNCNVAFQQFVHAMRLDVRGKSRLKADELITVTT